MKRTLWAALLALCCAVFSPTQDFLEGLHAKADYLHLRDIEPGINSLILVDGAEVTFDLWMDPDTLFFWGPFG